MQWCLSCGNLITDPLETWCYTCLFKDSFVGHIPKDHDREQLKGNPATPPIPEKPSNWDEEFVRVFEPMLKQMTPTTLPFPTALATATDREVIMELVKRLRLTKVEKPCAVPGNYWVTSHGICLALDNGGYVQFNMRQDRVFGVEDRK